MLLAGIGPGMLRAQGKKLGRDLMDMSLGDSIAVKVTSVSKEEQNLSKTSAGHLRDRPGRNPRLGATNPPDLLRVGSRVGGGAN
jgi:hypothetical protein